MEVSLLAFFYFLIGVGLFAVSGLVWMLIIAIILWVEYKLGWFD